MSVADRVALRKLELVEKMADMRIKRLEGTGRKLEVLLAREIESGRISAKAVDVALARANVENLLVQSGYYREVGALLNDDYQASINAAHDLYTQTLDRSFQFSNVSMTELDAMKEVHLAEFNRLGSKTADEITRGIVDLQFGAVTKKALIEEIIPDVIQGNQRYVTTWVNTGLAGYYSTASTRLATDNGFNRFRYGGVVNPDTRPFCQKYVGKIKTIEQWNALNAEQGQIAPVSIYRGGFNCVHALYAVDAGTEEGVVEGEVQTEEAEKKAVQEKKAPVGIVKPFENFEQGDAWMKANIAEASVFDRSITPKGMTSVAKGMNDVLVKNGVKLNAVGNIARMKFNGMYSWQRTGGKIVWDRILYRTSYMNDPIATATATGISFANNKEFLIRHYRNEMEQFRGINNRKFNNRKKKLDIVIAATRWNLSSVSSDPLYATAIHESAHAIEKHKGLTLSWENALKKRGIRQKSARMATLSEYSMKNSTESFSEAFTAVKLNLTDGVDQGILDAINEVAGGYF